MRRSLLRLLLALVPGFWGRVEIGSCAPSNSSVQLAPQPVPSNPVPQGALPASEALHDIRGPVLLPEAHDMLFWFLGGLALLIIAGLLLFFYWKRRKKRRCQFGPHEVALAELASLRPLMNREQALIYAARLSEILRRYIEARFLIHSTRQTTQEFFSSLTRTLQATATDGLNPREPGPESRLHLADLAATVSIMEEHRDRLHECLDQCDLAKFAHCVPDQQGMEALEQAVRGFIEATGQTIEAKGA